MKCCKLAGLIVVGCVSLMPLAAAGSPASLKPLLDGKAIAAEARGLWQLPAYGMLIDLRDGVRVYNEAGGLCWPDPTYPDAAALAEQFPYFAKTATGALTFAASKDGTRYVSTAVSTPPSACTAALDRESPAFIFAAVTASLAEFYPFEKEHDVRWAERAKALTPRLAGVTGDGTLAALLADLFQGVADAHTSLSGTVDGKALRLRTFRGDAFAGLQGIYAKQHKYTLFLDWIDAVWMPGEQAEAIKTLLPGTAHTALGNKMYWGRLPGNVGYLAVIGMGGYTAAGGMDTDRRRLSAALNRAFGDLRSSKALVLDISHNFGGDDEISADIAARFVDRVTPAYSKRAYKGDQVQTFTTTPSAGIHYRHPVYLLTSVLTSSAAEVFTMRMREIPGVVQVGEATQGIFSDATEKGLPNGWVLSMSTEVYVDAEGRNHEGIGMVPSQAFPVVMPAVPHSYAAVIRQVGKLAADGTP
jgi:carboxyl-terminal processing protease